MAIGSSSMIPMIGPIRILGKILREIGESSMISVIQVLGWIPFAIAVAIASVGYALIQNARNKHGGDRP
jgi:hypothetical protein